MKDEELKFGSYYKLDANKKYFSVGLQRNIQMDGVVVVSATHSSSTFEGGESLWFGNLVDTSGFVDHDTNNEIEFTAKDVVSEYEFRDSMPIDFLMPMNLV